MGRAKIILEDGTLPDGLELDAETGVISGIPPEGHVFVFTIR